MTTPTAKRNEPRLNIPPWQPLTIFMLLLALVVGLVFLTGPRNAEPKLGIDLQGGTRVTLTARTPDGNEPTRESLELARQIIEQRVNGIGVAGSEVVINGSNLVITVPGDDGAQARSLGQTARLFVRPVEQVIAAVPQPETDEPDDFIEEGAPGQTPDNEAAIAEQRELRQAPADATEEQLTALVEYMPQMNCAPDASDPLLGNDLPDQYLVACSVEGDRVFLLAPSIIDGRDIANATSGTNPQSGAWVVNVEFEGEARDFWPVYTGQNIGRQTAFTLDSRVISDPQINTAITTPGTEITGRFTQQQAQDLANALKYGSLPLSFSASDAETVSATLGLYSLQAGLIAGLVGLLAVFIYALLYYRMLGFLTIISLALAAVMVYGIIVLLGRWIGFTLDLAGVAGLIIGIGMTADSFVVYFERIKDEMREGRSFRSAVPRGWASARRTIWSGNAVSFIAAAVIYVLAVGEVRGFAFTLGLTTILDVVVVFLVTHPLVVLATRSKFLSKPSINGLGAVTEVARQRREARATLAGVGAATGGSGGDGGDQPGEAAAERSAKGEDA